MFKILVFILFLLLLMLMGKLAARVEINEFTNQKNKIVRVILTEMAKRGPQLFGEPSCFSL